MINQYDNLVEATEALKKRGFNHSYELKGEQLHCFDNDKLYNGDQLEIVEYHRFEGMTNPAAASVVFAIVADDGTKGTIISTYGAYMDAKLAEFLDKIKIQNQEERI